MYRRDIPEQRKESQVAKEAGLSTGIVSHYFGDKEGLLSATMRKILRDLRDAVAECRTQAASDSQSQLCAIIQGNFHPSQTNAIPIFAASSAASCRCSRRATQRAGWRR